MPGQQHKACKAASCQALAHLLEGIVIELPILVIVMILRPLPTMELARLACVHRAFLGAWVSLRQQCPGPRYASPPPEDLHTASHYQRLERASFFGDVAVVTATVAVGVHTRGQKRSRDSLLPLNKSLSRAAIRGHVEVVEMLLAAGADARANKSWALQAAASNGHTAVVVLLLRHGADAHADAYMALRTASWQGNGALVQVLLAFPGPQRCLNFTPRNAVRARCDSALRGAAFGGHTAVVQMLLEHEADVHAENEEALRNAAMNGHANVVQLLIQAGADVHASSDEALRRAAASGFADVVALLLDFGADIHAREDEALLSAVENGHTNVVALLLRRGAQLRGDGAVRKAFLNRDHAMVELLHKYGAQVADENFVALQLMSFRAN
jgi:ankyrin repeat protein